MTKKNFMAIVSILLLAVLFFSGQASAVNASRPAKYNASEWQGWVSQYGGNCYLFVANLLSIENRPSIRGRFTGGATISGYTPIDGGQVIIGVNRTSISPDDVKSIFANANVGYVVQMYWHWSYNSPHTAIVSAIDDNGVEFLQANYSAGKITNNYLSWSKLASVYNAAGNGGGASVYYLDASSSAPPNPSPTPIPTPGPTPPSGIEITSPSELPGTTKGTYFGYYLQCTGEGSTSWEKISGSLPSGIDLDRNSGQLYGYPGEIGTFTFTVKASNNGGTGTKEFTLTVSNGSSSTPTPPPSSSIEITTDSTLPSDSKGADYDFVFHCTGNGNTKWEKSGGSFPPDLQLDINSGRLWGHLNAAGTYTFKLIARNDSGVAEKTFSITIRDPNSPEITTDSVLPGGRTGAEGYDFYFHCTGNGNTKWEKSGGSFPPDLQFHELSGRLYGRFANNSAGTYRFKLIARNDSGAAEKEFSLTVKDSNAPEIKTDSNLTPGVRGNDYSCTFQSAGSGNISWEKIGGSFPPDLQFNGNSGRLSGHLNSSGTYTFTLRARNNLGTDERTFTLVVSVPEFVFTGSVLNDGIVGQQYAKSISVSGGVSPYTWETGGNIPEGLSFTSSGGTAQLSGTPSKSGEYNFSVKASDNEGRTLTKNYTVKVTQTVLTGTLPDGIKGGVYRGTLSAEGGKEPYTWTAAGTSLPDGLSLNPRTGEISGTPTQAGVYTFTVEVQDSNGVKSANTFTVDITQSTITGRPTNGVVKKPYSATLTVSGGKTPYAWTNAGKTLPAGLELTVSGDKAVLSGTPTKAGTYTLTLKITDGNNTEITENFSVKITKTTVKATIPSTIIRGASYTWTPSATGGTSGYTWSISSGKLPNGMSINASTGKITGKPTKAGTFTFTVQALDKNKVAGTKAFTVKVTQTTVKATIPATIIRGASYTWTPKASGGTADYTWFVSSGKLPTGMKINASTGKITGKPTSAGTFNFTVCASDKNDVEGTMAFTVKVTQTTVKATIPATIVRGASYTWTPKASAGTSGYTWSISSGKLPTGMKINASTGKITGKPTKAGTFTFTVQALDKNKIAGTKAFTVKVTQTTVTGTVPESILTGSSYTWAMSGSGGTSPYTWSIKSGTLPNGMTLNASTGEITGKPTKAGTFTFTVQAADKNKIAGTKAYTVKVIDASLKINGSLSTTGKVKAKYSGTLTVSGGTAPYTWKKSSGTLPNGVKLTYSGTKATLSGTPSKAGKFTFTLKVTDANGTAATKKFTVTITKIELEDLMGNIAIKDFSYSGYVLASNGTAPYKWSISSGKLPTGLKLTSSGAKASIKGKPTETGTFTFTVKAVDKNGVAATVSVSMIVIDLSSIAGNAGKSAENTETSQTDSVSDETSQSGESKLQERPLDLSTGNTDVNIRATLSVASDDVVESYEGKDSDMVKVKADKPLTFIIGKWPEEVESVTVYIDDKAVEGVTVTEGVFTLPAELVHNDFKVSAKAGKFESEEVFIISE